MMTTTTTSAKDNNEDEHQVVAAARRQQTDYIHLRSHSNINFLYSRLSGGQVYEQTQKLIVVCPGCEPDWNCPKVTTLFTGFQYLPKLMELKLNCIGLLDVPFPIRLLKVVVESCPSTLHSLELDDVALNCSTTATRVISTTTTATSTLSSEDDEEDYEEEEEEIQGSEDVLALAKAIERKSSSLQHFRLFGCLADDTLRLSSSSSPPSVVLNPFWMSLASLQKVELDAVDDGLLGDIQPTTVGHFLKSTSLQTFHLNGFALNDDCLMEMALALRSNTVLVDLSLDLYTVGSPPPPPPPTQRGDNSTRDGSGSGSCSGGFAFVDSLRENQSLKRLHISISHAWNDETFLGSLADALTTQCTLESLIIGTCAIIRDSTAHAFAMMLEQNCTLRVLQLSRYNGKWKSLLSYYLLLNNQARRGYFHTHYDSLSRLEWIDGLIEIRDKLDAIYYFIRMNPALYCGKTQ